MFGQLAPLGTGAFEILLDTSALGKARYIPDRNLVTDTHFELEDDEMGSGNTPSGHMGTPSIIPGGMTPSTPFHPFEGSFTPNPHPHPNVNSPIYPSIDRPFTPPYNQHKSPIYQPTSPGYSPGSNQSSPSK